MGYDVAEHRLSSDSDVPGPQRNTPSKRLRDEAVIAPPPAAKATDLAAAEKRYAEQRQRLIATAVGRVSVLRRLTAYRRANEELQNSFLALERHLPPGANALDLAFADERQSPEARMTLGWGSPGLAQVLPVASNGLSAIELSFCDIAARPDAALHVHLLSLEDQQVVDRWTIPVERLNSGWTMLTLTRPLVGAPRTLDLRLDFEGQADAGVSVHVGRIQPVRLFQLRNAGTDVALRPNGVSLRLWCGEPFAAHATQASVIVADARAEIGGVSVAPLTPTLLAKAAQANPDDAKFDFAPVSHVAYRAAIACHPPARDFTLASVPLPAHLRVSVVLADIEIGNDKARAVEFAAVLAVDASRAKELLGGASPRSDEAFSGWVAATHATRGQVKAVVQRPGEPLKAMFLATRMASKGHNNFAWARFRNISIAAAPR